MEITSDLNGTKNHKNERKGRKERDDTIHSILRPMSFCAFASLTKQLIMIIKGTHTSIPKVGTKHYAWYSHQSTHYKIEQVSVLLLQVCDYYSIS